MGRPKRISDEDLLGIARVVFLAHGVFGSTRDIANRAGISEAALFKRFSTKAQLFMAAMAPPSPGIEPVLVRAAAAKAGRDGLQILAAAVLDYFRVAIPMILPLIGQPAFGSTPLPREFHNSPAMGLLTAVAGHLKREAARGRVRVTEPTAAAGALVAALHSVVLFEIMGFHGGSMPKPAVRAMVDAMWEGLAPPRGRERKA